MEKAERNRLSQFRMGHRASEASRLSATGIYQNGCSGMRRLEVSDESGQMAIDSSDAMDARDDLLADVATFVKINCDPIEANFLRQGILGKFAVPARETALDPQYFNLVAFRFWQIVRRRWHVDSLDTEATDSQSLPFCGDRAKQMAALRGRRQQLEGDVVRYGIALEPRGKSFFERGLGLDNERLSIDPNENVRTEFSFSGEEQGRHGFTRDEAAKIIAKLAVEITKPVGTSDTHARALTHGEKASLATEYAQTLRLRRRSSFLVEHKIHDRRPKKRNPFFFSFSVAPTPFSPDLALAEAKTVSGSTLSSCEKP